MHNRRDFLKCSSLLAWGLSVPTFLVGDQVAPAWDNSKGQTIFQQQYTAHPEINATIEANDGLANAVITVLKQKGVAANKIPTVEAKLANPDFKVEIVITAAI